LTGVAAVAKPPANRLRMSPMGVLVGSEPVKYSGAPERVSETVVI
jgi:hypothetical protein